jgi:hypothetical protein
MVYEFCKKLMGLLVVVLLIISVSACGTTGGGFGAEWGKGSGYEGSPKTKNAKKGGPPPHAPAHGYRAKYQYRYYPSSSVYYDTGRKIYFYLHGENWRVSASLPNNLRVKLGEFVGIEMNTDKPYTHYKEHKAKYPPGQLKQKKHKKWSKH